MNAKKCLVAERRWWLSAMKNSRITLHIASCNGWEGWECENGKKRERSELIWFAAGHLEEELKVETNCPPPFSMTLCMATSCRSSSCIPRMLSNYFPSQQDLLHINARFYFFQSTQIACFDWVGKRETRNGMNIQFQFCQSVKRGWQLNLMSRFSAFLLILFPDRNWVCVCMSTGLGIECPLVDFLFFRNSIANRFEGKTQFRLIDLIDFLIRKSNFNFTLFFQPSRRLWKGIGKWSAVREQHQHNDIVNGLKWFH